MISPITARRVPPTRYRLSCDDEELRQVMPANIAAGFFAPDCQPAVFYDKCVQHLAIKRFASELAFEGQQLASLDQLPPDDGRGWVVRPARSPRSRGSAVLLWGEGVSASEAAELLRESPGPFLIHVHESGYPVFINGVFDAGQFTVSDAWRCHTQDLQGRRHLTAVTSLNVAALPVGLIPRLAAVAAELGMLQGPLHAELVITAAGGARLVKLSPRLASTPLPQLCRLGGWPSQQDCWQQPDDPGRRLTPATAVADYSFLITRQGRIKALRFDREVRALASFSHYFAEPALGQDVAVTTDGTTYGCTIFLRNPDPLALDEDIARLQALNHHDAFEFA
ncbi:hypothetical protein [Pseudomonas atagonensis]|uniref:hypothetical protein n=1 Tax=Pseudomonas atagonensis TaxID=2609964 RepID=UPI00140A334E|nr:hypothetical protein [Pseudomonas atagonensis]